MLANLTIKYSSLVSDIVERLNTSSNCGKVSVPSIQLRYIIWSYFVF